MPAFDLDILDRRAPPIAGILPAMRRRILVIAGVIVVGLIAGGALIWRAVQPPAVSDFYTAPSSLGTDRPGQVLRSEGVESPDANARLWRILYTTTKLDGVVVATSGLVAAPSTPAPSGGYPVVVVAHGTVGINRGCAPSIAPAAKVDETNTAYAFLVGQYVDAGYAVVMADFQGLGVQGDNSYLVGQIEGRNVLDAARALSRFGDIEVAPGMLLAGQSQGGHAALFAAQLAPTYAPELDIIGLAAQAPATDLEAMFLGVLSAGRRGGVVSLPVMAADAFARTYPAIDIDAVLTSRGRGALRNVISKLCLFPAILGTQLANPADLIQPAGLDVLKPFVDHSIPGTDFKIPMLIAQGDADQVVQPAITQAYVEQLCAVGANVTFKTYAGAGHFDVVSASTADVLAWMAAVRQGATPASTC